MYREKYPYDCFKFVVYMFEYQQSTQPFLLKSWFISL